MQILELQDRLEKLTNELEALQERVHLERSHGIQTDPDVHYKIYTLLVEIDEVKKKIKWKK